MTANSTVSLSKADKSAHWNHVAQLCAASHLVLDLGVTTRFHKQIHNIEFSRNDSEVEGRPAAQPLRFV